MSVGVALVLGAGLMAAVIFRTEAALRAVRHGFLVVIGLLGDITDALDAFLTRAWAFWGAHFAADFGIRQLLGGLLRLGLVAIPTLAEFELLRLNMESMLLTVVKLGRLPILGEETAAGLAAYATVGLTLILAEGILEMSGEAAFFSWRLSPRGRKAAAGLFLALFLGVCLLQAAAGVVRVWEGRQLEQLGAAGEARLLETPGAATPGPSPQPGGAPAWVGLWDRLPLWVVGTLGFIIPFAAGIVGARAIHALVMSLAGLVVAFPIAAVAVARALFRIAAALVVRIADFCEQTLALCARRLPAASAPPGPAGDGGPEAAQAARGASAAGQPTAGPRAGSSGNPPEDGPAPPGQGRESAGMPRAGSPDGQGPAPQADLDALAQALAPNPLQVPEDLVSGKPGGRASNNDGGGRR